MGNAAIPTRLSPAQLASLAKVDSPTVANVVELFGVRSQVAGYADPSLKALYSDLPPVAGYAVTATLRAAAPAAQGEYMGGLIGLLEVSLSTPAPRIAVFQDLDQPVCAASYGEIVATALQKFGFAGLLVHGAGRDVEQVRRLRFPCWTTSVIVSHGYSHFTQIQVPVAVAGLEVRPGGLLHADANGVVSIPHSIAAGVVDLCGPFLEAERILLDYLEGSEVTPGGYSQAYRRFAEARDRLRERARGVT